MMWLMPIIDKPFEVNTYTNTICMYVCLERIYSIEPHFYFARLASLTFVSTVFVLGNLRGICFDFRGLVPEAP